MDRYSDDRLDDRFAGIDARLLRLEGVPERVVALENQMQAIREDTRECLQAIRSVNKRLADQEEDHQRELRSQAHERKTDRRWLIGSSLTTAGLIIAAISLLADKVS